MINDFLSDKKVNGELYCLLQFEPMMNQAKMCRWLGIKSAKTLKAHMKYLEGKHWDLDIDRDVAIFLTCLSIKNIIKVYLFLGEKMKGNNCAFTSQEIGDAIGIKVKNYSPGYEQINKCLQVLKQIGLVDYYKESGIKYLTFIGRALPKSSEEEN